MRKAKYRDFDGLKLQMRDKMLEARNEKLDVLEQWDTLDVEKKCNHASRNYAGGIGSNNHSAFNFGKCNNSNSIQ